MSFQLKPIKIDEYLSGDFDPRRTNEGILRAQMSEAISKVEKAKQQYYQSIIGQYPQGSSIVIVKDPDHESEYLAIKEKVGFSRISQIIKTKTSFKGSRFTISIEGED